MSRRSIISEALASAPTETIPDAAVDAEETLTPKANYTNKRLESFGEAARMVKRPTIRLKPSECSVWNGNARDYELLDEHRVRSLIDSIIAENGNRIPVVVRRTPNETTPYELITGTRRHWAISWLNSNHYPDIDLVAIIEDIDDEAAFRLADIENREREDISDLERGRNYKAAVDFYYDGVQKKMADRLKLSSTQLWRYISLTEIPPAIVSAFASPIDLQSKHADKIMPVIKNPAARDLMIAAAKHIASEQSFLKSGNEQAISGAEVVKRLLLSVAPKRRGQKAIITNAAGGQLGLVEKDQKRGLTLSLMPSDLSVDELLEALRPVIENAKMRSAKL